MSSEGFVAASWPRAVVRAGGGLVFIISLLALLGSLSARPRTGLDAAGSLIALGAALVLAAGGRDRLANVSGTVASVLPGVTLVQAALGRDVVLTDAMAPASAAGLVMLALAILLRRRRPRVVHALVLVAVSIGYVLFVGQLYGSEELFWRVEGTSVPAATAISLVVAGVGVLCLRPDVGLVALLGQRGVIGLLTRQISVFAVLVPFVVSGIHHVGELAGGYDTAIGVAIMSLAWTAGLLAVVWWGGRHALLVERDREEALRNALEARNRLAMVANASSAFASTLELDELLESVSERMVDTLADACSVRLIDPTGERLLPVMIHHRDPRRDELFARVLGRSTRTDEGISGRCLRSRRPVLVANLNSRVGREAPVDFGRGQESVGLHSVIVVPLLAQERVLGVLAVVRDQTDTPFDDRDLALVEGLAVHAAQAIDNAQVVAKQRRSDAALTEFGRRALVAEEREVLEQHAVDLLQTTMSARYALLLTPGRDQPLTVAATAGPSDEPVVLERGAPITASVPLSVLTTGDALVCDDMRHDQDVGMVQMGELLAADSGMAVPVPGDSGLRGVLTVTATGIGRFVTDDLGFVRALAGILGAALDRLVAQQAVRAVAEERRALMDRLITAQEDERARIADGVHGDQVQVITAVDLRLEVLARRVENLGAELVGDVAFAQEAVAGAADRMRALLFELQPPDEGVDLADAVRSVAAHLLGHTHTRWQVWSDSSVRMSNGNHSMAYRIAKEALANVGLHAAASAVEVRITDADGGVLVSVIDDGIGMATVSDRSPAGHRGISSMRDWSAVAGGWLDATSSVGRGTTVRFWLPSGL